MALLNCTRKPRFTWTRPVSSTQGTRNRAGKYVACTCRSHVLRGKNGEPDLLAGVLVNHGTADQMDPATGIPRNEDLEERVRGIR